MAELFSDEWLVELMSKSASKGRPEGLCKSLGSLPQYGCIRVSSTKKTCAPRNLGFCKITMSQNITILLWALSHAQRHRIREVNNPVPQTV